MSKYILTSFGNQKFVHPRNESTGLRLTCKIVEHIVHANRNTIYDNYNGVNPTESTCITYLQEPLDEQLFALFDTFVQNKKVDILTRNYTTVCHVVLDNIPDDYKWLRQYIITNEQMLDNSRQLVMNCSTILELMIEFCTKDSDFIVVFELPNE